MSGTAIAPGGVNFFELLGLPQQFAIDPQQLGERYRQLQRQAHPDQRSNGPNPGHPALPAQHQAALINQAHDSLRHPDRRAAHLLELAGQGHGLDASIADVDFLQNALELREQLDEAHGHEALAAVQAEAEQWLGVLGREFAHDLSEADWPEARDTARKLAFIQRVIDDVQRRMDDADEWLDEGF